MHPDGIERSCFAVPWFVFNRRSRRARRVLLPADAALLLSAHAAMCTRRGCSAKDHICMFFFLRFVSPVSLRDPPRPVNDAAPVSAAAALGALADATWPPFANPSHPHPSPFSTYLPLPPSTPPPSPSTTPPRPSPSPVIGDLLWAPTTLCRRLSRCRHDARLACRRRHHCSAVATAARTPWRWRGWPNAAGGRAGPPSRPPPSGGGVCQWLRQQYDRGPAGAGLAVAAATATASAVAVVTAVPFSPAWRNARAAPTPPPTPCPTPPHWATAAGLWQRASKRGERLKPRRLWTEPPANFGQKMSFVPYLSDRTNRRPRIGRREAAEGREGGRAVAQRRAGFSGIHPPAWLVVVPDTA